MQNLDLTALVDTYRTDALEGPGPGTNVTLPGSLTLATAGGGYVNFLSDSACTGYEGGQRGGVSVVGPGTLMHPMEFSGWGYWGFGENVLVCVTATAADAPGLVFDDKASVYFGNLRIGARLAQGKNANSKDAVWLKFAFDRPVAVTRYAWWTANDESKRDPSAWRLQYSHDGVNWIDLDVQSGRTDLPTGRKVLAFDSEAEGMRWTCSMSASCPLAPPVCCATGA